MSENGADATARTALVTGGGRGIGRAIAAGLATDGFQVVIVDLREAEAQETVSLIE
ncbi:MAG TPA: SDR family NAD(P)-dependent oxidoreductase, partial [Baekduia sp.]